MAVGAINIVNVNEAEAVITIRDRKDNIGATPDVALTVPSSAGQRREPPCNPHDPNVEFSPKGEVSRPCRDVAMARSPLALRCPRRQSALYTLIRQSHQAPSCGGHRPNAERTVGLARDFIGSLTLDPELENSQGQQHACRRARRYGASNTVTGRNRCIAANWAISATDGPMQRSK